MGLPAHKDQDQVYGKVYLGQEQDHRDNWVNAFSKRSKLSKRAASNIRSQATVNDHIGNSCF